MATFSTIKTALDEISQRIQQADKRLTRAETEIGVAESDLAGLAGTYSLMITAIDDAATANPDDAAWQTAKAEKDLLVTEFQVLKTRATAMKNALAALG